MTRDISSANQTASAAATIHPVLFVELMFDSGAVRFHSELGEITWGGNTYTGTGRLGNIAPAEEDSELARTPLALTLSGIPNDVLALVLNEHPTGRRGTVYLGYLDLTTRRLVDDPFILYRGRMDGVQFSQGETLSLTLNLESRFAAWDRPVERRYNDADQQTRYPGDRGLEFVEQATEKEIVWGRK